MAEDARFCPNRPSLADSPCTVDPGRVLAEVSLIDWTRDDQRRTRDDTILAGDAMLRIGVTRNSEVQLGWTAYGHDRTRSATGRIDTIAGIGDVRLGFRQNLRNPDGSGFSFAIEPFATLPAGGHAIGAGTWGAGAVVPVSYDLGKGVSLDVTATMEAAPNASRRGRHLAYDGIVGLGYDLSDAITAVAEMQVSQDDDPAGATTQAVAAASLAWQPSKRTQLDVLVAAGLNRDTPDVRLVTGGAILFR